MRRQESGGHGPPCGAYLVGRTHPTYSTTRMAAEAKTRSDTVLDIDAQRVGALYAKALLSAAEAAGQTDAVLEEFDELVTGVLDRQPKFESILASGVVPAEEVVAVLEKAFGGRTSPLFLNFLRVLAKHGR